MPGAHLNTSCDPMEKRFKGYTADSGVPRAQGIRMANRLFCNQAQWLFFSFNESVGGLVSMENMDHRFGIQDL